MFTKEQLRYLETMPRKRKAQCGLAIFFLTLLIFSALLETRRSAPGNARFLDAHFIPVYMWCVALASFVSRLFLREPLQDVSFRWNGVSTTRAMLIATAFPLTVGLIAYGTGWGLGLGHFVPSAIPEKALRISITGSPSVRLWKYLFISLVAGGLWSCKSAAGEEIGWRGYMLTRLMKAGLPAPIFISGFIWALWHLPLVLGRQYASVPATSLRIVIFFIDITAAGYVFAWLRLYSASIWPCIWAHGVWNAVIPGAFDTVTAGGNIWVGEAGLLTAAAVIVFSVVLYHVRPMKARTRMIEPGDIPAFVRRDAADASNR